MRLSPIYTVTFSTAITKQLRHWRLWGKRWPALGDGWRRYAFRLGPVLLSWSITSEKL